MLELLAHPAGDTRELPFSHVGITGVAWGTFAKLSALVYLLFIKSHKILLRTYTKSYKIPFTICHIIKYV
jgi:hypothetical protein